MKKLILLFITNLCIGLSSFSQVDWRQYAETYPDTFNSDSTQVGIILCIEKHDESLNGMVQENYTSPNYEMNKAGKAEHDRERSGNNVFVYNFRKTPAYFFVKNVNSSNADEYEYQVTATGGKIIVPWSEIKQFEKPYFGVGLGSTGMMGALGSYTASYGQRINVKLRLKKSNEIISTAIAEWVSVHPKFSRVFTTDQMNDFFNLLTHDWIERNASKPDLKNLKSTQNNLIFLLEGTITDKSQMDYQLLKDGRVYLEWRKNDFDNNFIWLKNLPHGKYQLRVRYNAQPEHIGTCTFIINPAWYQTTAIKMISGSLLAVFFGLIVMVAFLLLKRSIAAF
jgi:two-component system LytT family sensor kinase